MCDISVLAFETNDLRKVLRQINLNGEVMEPDAAFLQDLLPAGRGCAIKR
jgi:hypothetical protein